MSGFLSFVGLAVMVVAVLRLFGRARWAHIASRRLAWLVLAAGFGIGMAGGALASSNTPTASAPTTSGPKPIPSPSGTLRWHANVAFPDSKLTPGGVFPVSAAQVCVP